MCVYLCVHIYCIYINMENSATQTSLLNSLTVLQIFGFRTTLRKDTAMDCFRRTTPQQRLCCVWTGPCTADDHSSVSRFRAFPFLSELCLLVSNPERTFWFMVILVRTPFGFPLPLFAISLCWSISTYLVTDLCSGGGGWVAQWITPLPQGATTTCGRLGFKSWSG